MIKKITLLGIILTSLVSCSSAAFNIAFEEIGMFDEKIKLEKISNSEKEVVFFPMTHLSTKAFYTDVQNKIDSLKSKGYFFLYEKVERDKRNLLQMKKSLKMGLPIGQKYSQIIEKNFIKKYNIQLKKEVIDQPMPKEMGFNNTNSINADITLENFIQLYEQEHGEVKLNKCEQEASSLDEMRKCKKNYLKIKNKQMRLIIDKRNQIVISEVVKNLHSKIAIIYGKNHWNGIKKNLIEKHQFKDEKVTF